MAQTSTKSTDHVTLQLGTVAGLLLIAAHLFERIKYGSAHEAAELHRVLSENGTDAATIKDQVSNITKIAGAQLPDDMMDHVFDIVDAPLGASAEPSPTPPPRGTGLGLDRPLTPPPGSPAPTPPAPTSHAGTTPPGTTGGMYQSPTASSDGFTRTAPPAAPVATHPVATGITGGATAEQVAATANADAAAGQVETPAAAAAHAAEIDPAHRPQVQQPEQ